MDGLARWLASVTAATAGWRGIATGGNRGLEHEAVTDVDDSDVAIDTDAFFLDETPVRNKGSKFGVVL